jgi:hypothetical protein
VYRGSYCKYDDDDDDDDDDDNNNNNYYSKKLLWFCLALNPLSYLLNRTNYGFGIHSGNQEMQ